MKYTDLSKYEARRLSHSRVCPICGNIIFNDEDLCFEKRKFGRKILYIFYHTKCKTV